MTDKIRISKTAPSTNVVTEVELKEIGRKLSSCMLDRYAVTTASVVLGTFLGIRKKNLRPFVSCVTIGTLGDLAWGYFYCCRDNIAQYMDAKRNFDAAKKKAQLGTPFVKNTSDDASDAKEFDMSDSFDSQSLQPPSNEKKH